VGIRFPDDVRAFAQPTIMGGRVFIGRQGRRVYSLNASTGCIHWVADVDFEVRSAITLGQHGQRWLAYFGDQHANAYALDALTGKVLWKTRGNDHPLAMTTGAPALYEGRLYVRLPQVKKSPAPIPTILVAGSVAVSRFSTPPAVRKI